MSELTSEAAEVATEVTACSKCGGVLDTTLYPKWCRKCRAANKREYESTKREMQETRGFAAGQTAMREYLANNFKQYGTVGSFSGIEISQIILSVKGPS